MDQWLLRAMSNVFSVSSLCLSACGGRESATASPSWGASLPGGPDSSTDAGTTIVPEASNVAPDVSSSGCANGSVRCGDLQPQACMSGQWVSIGSPCSHACSAGRCTGACSPTSTRCSGNGIQTCGADGEWLAPVACVDQACVPGLPAACKGVCAPSATKCADSMRLQTCQVDGQWGPPVRCTNLACVGDSCAELCTPGSNRCQGLTFQICNPNGAWESRGLAPGHCGAACIPGSTQCNGAVAQTCNASGAWDNAPLTIGECGVVCAPGSSQCSDNGMEACDKDGQWGPLTGCGATAPYCYGATCNAKPLPDPPSCQASGEGLSNCGPNKESCCASPPVAGGSPDRFVTFLNSVTLSGFRLDKYEITVGRFRRFVNAVVAGWLPPAGSGKHTHLNHGQGLTDTSAPGSFETGWDPSWDTNLATTQSSWDAKLSCDATNQTWTPSPTGNETLPINCVTWYEAHAFCIWDGGFLPSETEYSYAATGGNDHRTYPWSTPANPQTLDCAYANCSGPSDAGGCASSQNAALKPNGSPNAVGSESPKGDGKWAQTDLIGNVYQWTLDSSAGSCAPAPGQVQRTCLDCACAAVAPGHALGGSGFDQCPLPSSLGSFSPPEIRSFEIGARCARTP